MNDPTPMPDLHLLPGDAHPGLLLDWCGRIVADGLFGDALDGVLVGPDPRPEAERAGPWEVYRTGGWAHSPETEVMSVAASDVLLDLHRPECIDRVIRVLAADGHDLGWTRILPPWQAGPILAASVLRVVAREGPVRSIGTWDDWGDGIYHLRVPGRHPLGWYRETPTGSDRYPHCSGYDGDDWLKMGEEAKVAVEAAALVAGYALDCGDHILIPLTNGAVARVEAP